MERVLRHFVARPTRNAVRLVEMVQIHVADHVKFAVLCIRSLVGAVHVGMLVVTAIILNVSLNKETDAFVKHVCLFSVKEIVNNKHKTKNDPTTN